jgi:enediyne biosynthesis protein E4
MFLNRGDHFEAKALPLDAQLAPASYAGVADFDGDGNEDVFLSQNFYPTALGIPRYAAGSGLLLTGDGRGSLTPLAGSRSGILVYGDQRGAAYADMDGDGRLDLAVSQNGAATRLFRNRGAKPGLRVRVEGPPANPDGIGAQIRVVYGERMGPVREVQAGSGYWSQNGAVQVLGLTTTPTAVWVRWPGGRVTRTAVPPGARELVVNGHSP